MHRLQSAAQVVQRVRAVFAPLGITRVANVTGLDNIGIPVTMVCRPNARSLSVSQGKGVDLDSARASGVMEAVELYHAERVTSPLELGSWNDLRFAHDLISIDLLPRHADSQFHPDHPILWIEGAELLQSRRLWLPYELVHTNFTVPLPSGSGCFIMSSNGLGSGSHHLEAVRHGLCEVIERDAAALFRFRSLDAQRERQIALDSVRDVQCRNLLDAYAKVDVAVGVWDMTTDVQVPAYRCIILDRSPNAFRPLGPAEGTGCHPRREVALSRALTEAAQARLTLISGSRDDNDGGRYLQAQDAALIERARDRLAQGGHRRFESTLTHHNETLEDDVACLLRSVSDVGLREVVVVDLEKPALGIPVVRVIVPGLEPYHHVDGYIPGPRAMTLLRQLVREQSA